MKICYVDESGTHEETPLIVMAGIVADSQRLGRTREEFASTFTELGSLGSGYMRELKGVDLYRGRKKWQAVEGSVRHQAIDGLCDWLVERKHSVALASLDKEKFHQAEAPVSDAWLVCALHIALQVQRSHQKLKRGKGQTFLVFDESKRHTDALPDLLFDPPAWSEDFYDRAKKEPVLGQILDTAFYAKSHQIGLVQIADLFSFILRRYAEVVGYGGGEGFAGEKDRLAGWAQKISSRLLPRADRWPKKTKSHCAKWYTSVAPDVLKQLE